MGLFDFFKKFTSQEENNQNKMNIAINIENEIPAILKKKLPNGLLPGEIILMDWVRGKSAPLNYPQYFELSYGINPSHSTVKLFQKGYLEYSNDPCLALSNLTVSELKAILKSHNLKVSGKKSELINRIIENEAYNDQEINSEKIYDISSAGLAYFRPYSYIVEAHKDRYVPVDEIIQYQDTFPDWCTNYNDMKWAYLGIKGMEYWQSYSFGLLRNNYSARADMLLREGRLIDSLRDYIVVTLYDCSGLDNSCEFTKKAHYMEDQAVEYMLDKIIKINNKIDSKDYEEAFQGAITEFSPAMHLTYIDKEDLLYFKKELRNPSKKRIDNYLKKYDKPEFY
ncbi:MULTISPECIES: SAP domain-containing protein [Aerococcus]|uniref:SAP domain-containing protein n=1 Tax=Aerococcus TaxID=1375 RepID=UPI000DCF6363|nr:MULTISPECIES: SAP domain-containing protein [Aerococcus]KAA9298566.1 hypothetical protein F6I08_05495 [Aerococcus tenax]MDK6688668.1 SAP domain-containing protein [Aerococcus urinae]MDK8133123.1 SAP domain-containing protein [Aerococcus urinae]MDK8485337.1 SAP domain-containing protein [Aerococcus urinae]MDL5177865.1 SAP domain-containing protein [Aerococcus tenax]